MTNILSFDKTSKKNRAEATGSGQAFCLRCKHEWVACSPVGVLDLECPECKTMKGRFRFEFQPADGQLIRVCNCGNEYFYLTPDGHMCVNCGMYQSY